MCKALPKAIKINMRHQATIFEVKHTCQPRFIRYKRIFYWTSTIALDSMLNEQLQTGFIQHRPAKWPWMCCKVINLKSKTVFCHADQHATKSLNIETKILYTSI